MANGSSATQEASEREFVITRTFEAPRELVFKAWTDPKRMAQWWGPHGFTNPICELDARPGSAWRIVMRGPDGVEHPARGVYREIVEPERLVMTIDHSGLPDQWHDMVSPGRDRTKGKPALEAVSTVTFEEVGGKTKVTVRQRFESAGVRDALLKIGMNEGWSQSLERLGAVVSSDAPQTASLVGDREIVITREFDASRETVFEAWTNPEQLVQWWGPRGFTTTVHEMDVRPGGVWRLTMRGPDGRDYRNRIVFVEVVKPERLVYRHAPEEGSEPVSFETTVTFAAEGSKTKVTIRQLFPSGMARDHVVKTYHALEGAAQTLGRLAEHLAAAS
jgi:uncharacterized protein YndB with AHSA1/START domain